MENNGFLSKLIFNESGQGITEYGAILGFVTILIVVVAGFTNGDLQVAISECFSEVTDVLNSLLAQSSGP